MIQIFHNDITRVESQFIKRIEDSVIKNKLSKTEKKKLGANPLSNGTELQKRVHNLYCCKPELLKKENALFDAYLSSCSFTTIQKINIQKKYFDYETTIKYIKDYVMHAYWLMQKLNIRVCPYCNRTYTFTIDDDEGICRPEYDHFYCQKNFPYLSLSFYNLIPSCPICNHKKNTTEISIHPYIEGFGVNCKFKIENIENCLLDSRNYDIWSVDWEEHEDRFDSNINTFLLEQFYNEHKDFISEIVFKTRAYNSGYYQTLLETFVDKGLSSKEMHLLIFGTYTENDELGLRPLSKLSSDIIEQVGMESL
ncbi:MAG: hypothetical protein WCK78_14510 [Paludibacter sp.]